MARGLRDCVPRGVLIMPTSSYSFCEGEAFDVATTPSRLGVLTEHFRGVDGVRRTTDPIFSCAVLGDPEPAWQELFEIGDKDCFGPRSVFAHLVAAEAKVLFVGTGFEACTLVHHAEQLAGVPYRYLKDFHGEVQATHEVAGGDVAPARAVTDADVETYLQPLGDALLRDGHARAETLARGPRLLAVEAGAVVWKALATLGDRPDFLLRRGHLRPPPEPVR